MDIWFFCLADSGDSGDMCFGLEISFRTYSVLTPHFGVFRPCSTKLYSREKFLSKFAKMTIQNREINIRHYLAE